MSARQKLRTLALLLAASLLPSACEKSETVSAPADSAPQPIPHGMVKRQKSGRTPLVAARLSRYGGDPSLSGLEIGAETPEETAEASRLLALLHHVEGMSAQNARDILVQARSLQSNAILRVAARLMDHPDEEVRAEALLLADGVNTADALPLVEKAMAESSPDMRRLAMEIAVPIQDAAVMPLIESALADADEGVRVLAMHAGMNQEQSLRWRIIERALDSPHPDLVLAALSEADATPSKNAIPRIIRTLSHPSPEVRELASEILSFLAHQPLTDTASAHRWWQSAAASFDDDLVYQDPVK